MLEIINEEISKLNSKLAIREILTRLIGISFSFSSLKAGMIERQHVLSGGLRDALGFLFQGMHTASTV